MVWFGSQKRDSIETRTGLLTTGWPWPPHYYEYYVFKMQCIIFCCGNFLASALAPLQLLVSSEAPKNIFKKGLIEIRKTISTRTMLQA